VIKREYAGIAENRLHQLMFRTQIIEGDPLRTGHLTHLLHTESQIPNHQTFVTRSHKTKHTTELN